MYNNLKEKVPAKRGITITKKLILRKMEWLGKNGTLGWHSRNIRGVF